MDIALKNYSLSFETKKFFNDELLLKKKLPVKYKLSEPNKGFPLKAQLTINLYYNFFRGMLLTEVISAIIKVKYRNLFDYLLRQFKQTEFLFIFSSPFDFTLSL